MLGDELVGTVPFAGEVLVEVVPRGRSLTVGSAIPSTSTGVQGARASCRSVALALPSTLNFVLLHTRALSRALAMGAAMTEASGLACKARCEVSLQPLATVLLGLRGESYSDHANRCFVRCQGGGLCVDFRHDQGDLPQIIFQ